MEQQVVNMRMFRSMELEWNGRVIKNTDNRSQKLWLTLANIICFRQKGVSQEALLAAVWNRNEAEAGVLKTALHRIRTMLAEEFDESFAKEFISCQRKTYSIDESYTLVCDTEEFEEYIRRARREKEEEEQFRLYRCAFDLYRGDFLGNFSDVPWVVPLNVYYRNLYLEVICSMLGVCERRKDYEEAVFLLQQAAKVVRDEETLYVYLMRNLVRMEKYKDTMKVYGQLTDMLAENFDTKPSDEARSLYYEAMYALRTDLVDINDIAELVAERDVNRKAMYCEFDFFKELYHAYCGGISRSRHEVCLAVINLTDIQEQLLSKRSLTCCVANLKLFLCVLRVNLCCCYRMRRKRMRSRLWNG